MNQNDDGVLNEELRVHYKLEYMDIFTHKNGNISVENILHYLLLRGFAISMLHMYTKIINL